MPRATLDTSVTYKHDLKSLPEGWVELRKLTYGQMLHRQELAGDLAMKGDTRDKNSVEAVIKMAQKVVTLYEFKHCIVDHNLTDEADNKLDFSVAATFDRLDPQVGQEIADLIDSHNQLTESPNLADVSSQQ